MIKKKKKKILDQKSIELNYSWKKKKKDKENLNFIGWKKKKENEEKRMSCKWEIKKKKKGMNKYVIK